jgi:TolA-binding protein
MDELREHQKEAQRLLHEEMKKSTQAVSYHFRKGGWIPLVIGVTLFTIIFNGVWSLITRLRSVPPLEKQIEISLKQLQEDSNRSLALITKLQKEISQRKESVQQAEQELNTLRQQKSALELTDEQKRAIQSLIRQQPSTKEYFTSKDFWLGKVLVSAVFLIIGLIAGRWMRRFDNQTPGQKQEGSDSSAAAGSEQKESPAR